MPLRSIIAFAIYLPIASVLLGVGLVAATAVAPFEPASLVKCCMAALLLAIPLSLEAAPLLGSARERSRIDVDER